MINTFKHPIVSSGDENHVNILDFGADTSSNDNSVAIQNAIDHASTLVTNDNDVIRVKVPEGTFFVDGTIYNRSNVELVGSGTIKAVNNAKLDYVDWGGVVIPTRAKTLFAITGTESNPIKNAGVRGVTFDYNGENQEVEPRGSYIGVAISQAVDCWAYETSVFDVVYDKINPEETPDKMRAICLFVANALNTKVVGGKYWGSGYDAIRVAGGAINTSLINVVAGKAKRGAIQFTPLSDVAHLINCTFDNRDGGTQVSHAFFAHNLHNVNATNLTLKAHDGYCIAIFSDGNTNRNSRSSYANLKNVYMENNNENFVNLSSQNVDYYNNEINIQGVAITNDNVVESSRMPFWISRTHGANIDVVINNISRNPILVQNSENIKLKIKIATQNDMLYIVRLSGDSGVNNIVIADSVIDAINVNRAIDSQGTSDNIKIINTQLKSIDSVKFEASDKNIILRDCDFREVENQDKLRLVDTESVIVDNVLGIQ